MVKRLFRRIEWEFVSSMFRRSTTSGAVTGQHDGFLIVGCEAVSHHNTNPLQYLHFHDRTDHKNGGFCLVTAMKKSGRELVERKLVMKARLAMELGLLDTAVANKKNGAKAVLLPMLLSVETTGLTGLFAKRAKIHPEIASYRFSEVSDHEVAAINAKLNPARGQKFLSRFRL